MSDQTKETNTENKPGTKPDNRRMRVILALIPLVLFAALSAVFFKQLKSDTNPSELPSPLLGKAAPEFAMPALDGLVRDGKQIPGLKTADFNGKVTVVNVWASWCVPCRAEHPIITELGKDKRLRLVGINYKDKPKNAMRFLSQLGNPFDAVGVDQKGRAVIDWGVYGIPETFIIGRDATIRYKHVGPLNPKSLEKFKAEIDKAVAG
jgi:cytochrome c biogenesis protein CcmG/thiol:disulfide interchange protein DsbE